MELPDPALPRSRRIAEFRGGAAGDIVIAGPERVAIVGPNGSGKTTLLRQLVSGSPTASCTLLTDRFGYLPQRLDGLDDAASAVQNVQAVAPDSEPGDVRNRLARLLIRGAAADRPVSTLSGGERFRVSLATLLFAQPPSHVLIVDEPTNNLDVASVEHLAEALDAYRGALIVVSHDNDFLRRIGIDTVIEMGPEGTLRQRADLPE
ncbi:ATP-binding cassette domain-containing protein [Gordonia spumicola]